MGIFDKVNTDSDSKRDEVEISMPDESSGSSSKKDSGSRATRSRESSSPGALRNEVETRLTHENPVSSDKDSSRASTSSGSTVTMEDIHDQNEKIIRLLETLTEDPEDKNENENDAGMAGGLDGVL
ncbi:MAG: hypothetical protein ABEJ72_08650 [Candidatus Aenigmatarchaeota archaeon]